MNRRIPYRGYPGAERLFLGGAVDWVGDQVSSAADSVGNALQNEWVQTIGATAVGGPLAGALVNDTARNWMAENPQTVGTVLGGAAGTVLGNPMMGAQIGRQAGGIAGSASEDLGRSRKMQDKKAAYRRNRRGMAAARRAMTSGYGGTTGSYNMAKGGAMKLSGRSHEQGGINLPGNTEVEGGETIGNAQGGKHAFSQRLKVPGTDMTFAQMHEQLIQRGAGQDRINQLAQLQHQVAGRENGGTQMAQDGGPVDDSLNTELPPEARGRSIPNPFGRRSIGMTGATEIPGRNILSDFGNELDEEFGKITNTASRYLQAAEGQVRDIPGGDSVLNYFGVEGGEDKLADGGKYHAIKASETSGDDPKYPINSADDVRDAWKLRNHGDYNISKEKLENRIKRKAREYDVDLPTGDDSKAYGGALQFLSGMNTDRVEKDIERNTKAYGGSLTIGGERKRKPDMQSPEETEGVVYPGGRLPNPATMMANRELADGGVLSAISSLAEGAGMQGSPNGGFFDLISGGGEGIAGGTVEGAEMTTPGLGSMIPDQLSSPSMAQTGGGQGQGEDFLGQAGDFAKSALPYLPGAFNAARGLFEDAEGVDLPRVNIGNRSIDAARNMETDIDVEPQIAQAEQAFRSIAADPNMSNAQKQAAFSKLMQQRSQIRSQEENKETQLGNQRQQMLAKLMGQQDRVEAQANQRAATTEAKTQMQAEAAKQKLLGTGITQMVRAQQRQQASDQAMNRNLMGVLASTAGAPQDVRDNVINSIAPLMQNERARRILLNSIGQ